MHGGGGWNAQRLFALAGGLKQWFWKNNTVNVGWIAKSVTEKNNSRVDCAEVGKKTVQALHFDRLSGRQAEWAGEKGWGFLPAGDCPGGAARNYHSGETWPLSSELYLLQLSNIIMSIIIWFLVRIVELKIKCWVVFFLSTPSCASLTGGYSHYATLWHKTQYVNFRRLIYNLSKVAWVLSRLNKTDFYIWISENAPWLRSCGFGWR